jgi:hypothetical protein
MKSVLLVFLVFSSFTISAQECKRVHLPRKKWSLKLRNMPNYNQGNTGICYAYSAIQLVDYWRLTHRPRITKDIMLSSPLYTAYITKKNHFLSRVAGKFSPQEGTPLDIGIGSGAIDAIRKEGMCREDVVQESISQFAKKFSLPSRSVIEVLHGAYSHWYTKKKSLKFYQSWKPEYTKEITNAWSPYWCKMTPSNATCKGVNKFIDFIINKFRQGKYMEIYDEIFSLCKKPESIILPTKKIPPAKAYTWKSQNFYKKKIIERLDRKKPQPLIISYCADILYDDKHDGLLKINAPKPGKCMQHLSIIAGKRTRNGKCQFFLKNTWGENCDSEYSDKWKCATGKGFNKRSIFGMWLDADDLSRNIYEVTYLDI